MALGKTLNPKNSRNREFQIRKISFAFPIGNKQFLLNLFLCKPLLNNVTTKGIMFITKLRLLLKFQTELI